jgi:peptidoglycan/xylan/chitin deacetylase (PgdA/CDA1 family)
MNRKVFMFHEVLDESSDMSGFHQESNGKYTISLTEFRHIVLLYGRDVIYTFDDGGKSNLIVAKLLEDQGIKGIFCVPTAFIGKPGFLSESEVYKLSKYHDVIPHGHNHIMRRDSAKILFNDWAMSISKIESITSKKVAYVCLPGGTFSRRHSKVFSALNIMGIYHSAPSNLLLNVLYKRRFDFIPRVVVISNTTRITNFFISFKSYIKQIINY